MERRNFLKKLILSVPAIIVGDEVLEYLNHKKVFIGADFAAGKDFSMGFQITNNILQDDFYLVKMNKSYLHSVRYGMPAARLKELYLK